MSPGAFAAIFPIGATNIVAGGTDSATAFPLLTTLADTQVLVNNIASPLLFVSPARLIFRYQ